MEKALRDLYWNNVTAIDEIGKMLEALRVQNEHRLFLTIPLVTEKLSLCITGLTVCYDKLVEAGLPWNMDYLLSVMTQIGEMLNVQDYILMGDLYELQLIPSLLDIQDAIRQLEISLIREEWWEQNLLVLEEKNPPLAQALREYQSSPEFEKNQKQYSLEPTTIGCFTLALSSESGFRYLHSNRNPLEEARRFAERFYRLEQERYLVIGWGMGYHIQALSSLYSDMELVVVESDLGILCHSLSCWDFREILERVQILWDKNFQGVWKCLEEQWELVLFRPELFHITDSKLREQFIHLANRKDSIADHEAVFYQNARVNIRNCDRYVDEIRDKLQGKRVVIVAGGPSLDKNLENLKEKPEDVVILAVGTVFRLLVDKGISVDYIVFADIQVFPQIQGLEECQIPILLLSTADRRISRTYQGPKYLVCQQGYHIAAKYAEKMGYMCYDSGGSVVTLALDIAIRMQAASIAFVGLDLAYYGTRSHASGTLQENLPGHGKWQVESVDGTMLNTSQVFNEYREWMERRIQKEDVSMEIIDATEGGAKKKGFQVMTLVNYLSQ